MRVVLQCARTNFLCALVLLSGSASAQSVRTLSGFIRDAETSEVLVGATVSARQENTVGASSNASGYFSLSLPDGRYTVEISYVGYQTRRDTVTLNAARKRDYALVPDPVTTGEVTVSGARPDRNVSSTLMGVHQLEGRNVSFVPALLGEKDVLKTIQLLPGFKSSGEGHADLYARGGGADQNLILLDDAPIYNSSHLLGFVSAFNGDVVKEVSAITGGIPAEYGGRLSSVVDIRTNDGNAHAFRAGGGIGLLASRFMVDGPIADDAGSFLLSARRTYADIFLKLSRNDATRHTSLWFYDANVKATYTLGPSDRASVSAFTGRDHFHYPGMFGYHWGNSAATARWNHVFSGRLFASTSVIFSDYEYASADELGAGTYTFSSAIRDLSVKTDFQLETASEGIVKFGINLIRHAFAPGTTSSGSSTYVNIPGREALESAAYVSHELDAGSWLKINSGLRISMYSPYASVEPRLALNVRFDTESAVKASYTRTAQYLHLVSNSSMTNPRDLWLSSTGQIRPQHAEQTSIGYFRNFAQNMYEASLEVYYKDMRNLLDYQDGANPMLSSRLESLLLTGRGWSYGAELLLKKTSGRLNGWLAYTWSRTEEQFPQINRGQPFPARYDRTHEVSLVAMYELTDHWQIGATWVFSTGNAVTFPAGNYLIDGRLISYYTARNGYRMPSYHRLDLSVTCTFSERSSLNFSVYNVYNRANAYALMFRATRSDPPAAQIVQLTLFPIIPSLTYNFGL